ncbi:MAG: alkaline phosphatase [Pseudomonadota bacterium]
MAISFKKAGLACVMVLSLGSTAAWAESAPKYVFMFIGDGMSHVQTQIANYYLDSLEQDTSAALAKKGILKSKNRLAFMDFDSIGITNTYDSTSFTPDSASTATSLATGKKTHSGTINMDETFTVPFETIAEKVKKQLGYKVGIVTSVTMNHATPAAYYAHNKSRNNYYEIGEELVHSGFEYFAGGEIAKHDNKGQSKSLYELAKEEGYTVVLKDQKAAEAISKNDGKVIIVGEDADGALPYETDRAENMWALADFVEKGIEVLDNDKGFFMMVEAGKIDWACHANDAKASIYDTIAFDNAIRVAYEFYQKHPEETLIVVTGDHETGGLTIGYAGTQYDTFLAQLQGQKGSYDKYEAMVKEYAKAKTSFETVMQEACDFFGLAMPNDATANEKLVLTAYELGKIKQAYEVSVNKLDIDKNEYAAIYGGYEPLAVTVLHILNNKSGVDFTSFSHTGVPVATYAHGASSDKFAGFYDNTKVFHGLADALNVR